MLLTEFLALSTAPVQTGTGALAVCLLWKYFFFLILLLNVI